MPQAVKKTLRLKNFGLVMAYRHFLRPYFVLPPITNNYALLGQKNVTFLFGTV